MPKDITRSRSEELEGVVPTESHHGNPGTNVSRDGCRGLPGAGTAWQSCVG